MLAVIKYYDKVNDLYVIATDGYVAAVLDAPRESIFNIDEIDPHLDVVEFKRAVNEHIGQCSIVTADKNQANIVFLVKSGQLNPKDGFNRLVNSLVV